MYVDYGYYSEQYGGDIAEKEFPKYERKAEAYVRNITFVQGDIFAEESEAVKNAVCAVAEEYYAADMLQKNAPNGLVKSENNDGYSVTYVTERSDGQTAEELLRKKAYDAAYIYLLPTGWLSRKVGCGYADQCGHYNL